MSDLAKKIELEVRRQTESLLPASLQKQVSLSGGEVLTLLAELDAMYAEAKRWKGAYESVINFLKKE